MTVSTTNQSKLKNKITIRAGLALFAMFFGASNLIFPLYIGANSGQHIFWNILGFLIGGVGIPLIGSIAAGMFNGDYWAFFNRIGKVPAFLLILLLMLIIGPLGAMPRIETLVFNTLKPYMPGFFAHNASFSLFFCGLVFILAYKENKIVDILGVILSPIKIITVLILIAVGIFHWEPEVINTSITAIDALKNASIQGYCTMDLLATFFFCAIAFQYIDQYRNQLKMTDSTATILMIKSSLLAGFIISVVYIGFMLLTYNHAQSLQNIPVEHMVKAVSSLLLGKFGGLFVCVIVSFACLATVLALTEVCSEYLHHIIFAGRISRTICLSIVIILTYIISNVGFQAIMMYTTPILEVIYPAIITISVMNILYKYTGIKMIKIPVFLVAGIFLFKKLF